MKTEDEADTFMKPTYYRSSLLIPNQKSIIIRSMKRLIKPHFANEIHLWLNNIFPMNPTVISWRSDTSILHML